MGKLSATLRPLHGRRAGGPYLDAGAHRRSPDLYPNHPGRGHDTWIPSSDAGSQMLVHGGERQLRTARSERSGGAAAVAAPLGAVHRAAWLACTPWRTALTGFTLSDFSTRNQPASFAECPSAAPLKPAPSFPSGSSTRVLSRRRPRHERVDDRVDVSAGVHGGTGLRGIKGFQGVELRPQQYRRHEVAGPDGQPPADKLQ